MSFLRIVIRLLDDAIACYNRALELTSSLPIRRFLLKRIAELSA